MTSQVYGLKLEMGTNSVSYQQSRKKDIKNSEIVTADTVVNLFHSFIVNRFSPKLGRKNKDKFRDAYILDLRLGI